MREVWPRMPVVLSWTGASAAAQLPLLEPFLGGVRVRDNPYICTEAAITVPVYDGAEGHPLHPGATIMAVSALLAQRPDPSDEQIDATVTNICRCGTFVRVRRAIHAIAEGAKQEERHA